MFSNKHQSSMKYNPLEPLQQMEDEWGLGMPETSEDRVKFLKREFRFMDIFLNFQSFTDEHKMLQVTGKVQALFRDADVDLRKVNQIQHVDAVTSQVQENILMTKLEIAAEYSFPEVSSDKVVIATPRSVIQFIGTVVENLGDLVKIHGSGSLLFVPGTKKELSDVFKELKLLRNFVCFISDRCKEAHSQYTNFFTHVLLVVGHVAMVAWLYLPINGYKNHDLAPVTMNNLLSDLLQTKIKPIQPGVCKIFIDVLKALRLVMIQSQWHPINQIEHAADCGAGFVESLQHNLKELPTTCKRIISSADQIIALQEMLRLLVANLNHLSIQDIEYHLPDIDMVMVDSALLVYSLYIIKEEKGHIALAGVRLEFSYIIQRIKKVIYRIARREFQSNLPQIHGLGYVDFILNNLKEFESRYSDSLVFYKTQIQIIQKELERLQPFLKFVVEEQRYNHDKIQHSVGLLIGKAYEVEYIVDACVSKKVPDWCITLWLLDITEEIRAEVAEIQKMKMVEVDLILHDTMDTYTAHTSSDLVRTPRIDEDIVGFEDEIKTLRDRLIRGHNRLDVVSIFGMGGAGKTTLANRLYFDKSVVSHFDIRAQCHVSQVYSRRGLFLSILALTLPFSIVETSLIGEETDELGDVLFKHLLGRRYLILLDDVWDLRAWDDLRCYLCDSNNRSRILLTTRHYDVAYHVNSVAEPLSPRLFNSVESWKLLKMKVFGDESCSPLLENVGQEIARKCRGLPLAVVLAAGVLAKMEKTEKSWCQVAKDLASYISIDLMAVVEQSYQSLPYHLKPCFLYFGTFLEDKEIDVSKLTWLWIGEGFVKEKEDKSLEDTAEGYLESLISRNLVIAKKSFVGKVKACCIHDLLLYFCKKKAEEEHLLLWINRDQDANSSSGIRSHKQLAQHRLAFTDVDNLVECSSSSSPAGSIFYRENTIKYLSSRQLSVNFHNFKFLKVLDLESIVVCSFPTVLVYLRYFAAQTAQESITSSIANLWNLETLILKPVGGNLTLPIAVWKMVKLRHVCIDNACFSLNGSEEFIGNLNLLSCPIFSCAKDVELLSRRAPNLRVMRCSFGDFRHDFFPNLDFLTQLETLEIHLAADSVVGGPYNFPSSLKNVTLSNFFLGSCHESNISKLPKLHVLKLVSIFFDKDEWKVSKDEFLNLKVLKLVKCEFFEEWQVSDDAFRRLEYLVLRDCPYLKAIPICLRESSSLKSIKVKSCNESVDRLAMDIRETQVEAGNLDFDSEVFIQQEKRDQLSEMGLSGMSIDEVVQEVMRIHRSLPTRPGIDEVEAAKTLAVNLEKENQLKLDAIARQDKGKDVPEELYNIMQEMQRRDVHLQSKEQKGEVLNLLDLEIVHLKFDDLILRASKCLPSSSQQAKASSMDSSSFLSLENSAASSAGSGSLNPLADTSIAATSLYNEKERVKASYELFSRDDTFMNEGKGTFLVDVIGVGPQSADASSLGPMIGDSNLKPATSMSQYGENLSLIKLASMIEVSSKKGIGELILRNKLSDQVEWIPDSIGKLSSLITLDLSENRLTQLPATIGGLSSLQKLNLHANRIIELPYSIGALLNLVYLDLSANNLKSLPATFELPHLQELDLSSNMLSVLPETVGSLVSLRKLIVETNDLEELPYTIGQCTSLKELRADYNRLKTLPYTIGQCTSLKELRADYNRLKTLPKLVGRLGSLEILSVRYNCIRNLPTTMAALTSLKELNVSFNEIEAVPETLCFVTTLEKLNISNNFADLRSLPRSIGNLKLLECLDMSNNQIRVLPDSFRMLSCLRILKADGNPLEIPPGDILEKGPRAVVQYMGDLVAQRNVKMHPVKKKKFWAQILSFPKTGGGT